MRTIKGRIHASFPAGKQMIPTRYYQPEGEPEFKSEKGAKRSDG